MRFTIYDLRFTIRASLARRDFARRRHDRSEFVGFVQQCGEFPCRHDAGLDKQFEPQRGFIGFFLDRSDFGNEFGLTSRSTTRAIICCDRSSTPQDLLGNNAARVVVFGNCSAHPVDSQSKSLGSRLEFGWLHAAKLQIQSPISNRQSAISK